MESYYAFIRRFIRARLRGSEWVEDLVQETFARAFAAQAVRPVSAPHAFLVRTASNLLADFHRRTRSRDAVIDTAVDSSDVPLASEPLEDAMSRFDDLARLQSAIDALPPKCRRVFVLHKLEGYTQVEIAERFGVSTAAVERHVGRAMVRLRRALTRHPT